MKNIHEKDTINRGLSRATLELSTKNNNLSTKNSNGLGTNLSQNERNYIDNIKNKG